MDLVLLKRAAIQSFALMLAVISISYAFTEYKEISANNKDIKNSYQEKLSGNKRKDVAAENNIQLGVGQDNSKIIDMLKKSNIFLTNDIGQIDTDIINRLGSRFLVIKKPVDGSINISLQDLYVSNSIKVTLSTSEQMNFTKDFLGRFHTDEFFFGEPSFVEMESFETDDSGEEKQIITKNYGNDIVHGITITNDYNTQEAVFQTEYLIELDDVYTHTIYEDSIFFYIDLKNPKEVYDKVIVIDTGHGGKDAGSLSFDQAYYEKDINLGIVLHLKEFLDQENIKVYYTRLNDDKLFLKPRVNLANAVNCDFFISIHCNASTDRGPQGTEVLYYDTEFNGIKTHKLAEIMLDQLTETIPLEKREIIKLSNDDIFILEHAKVPAVIVEVGFMTNYNDMMYLSDDENRMTIAKGIYNGILKAYEEFNKE
ncbi:MAG: hypothetical protein K0S47_1534 [Herbinix sp.]|jgi:N-acetylmuramoyl-L-alanine amidase|nr:hypothetical protein [Herbinix sp.]